MRRIPKEIARREVLVGEDLAVARRSARTARRRRSRRSMFAAVVMVIVRSSMKGISSCRWAWRSRGRREPRIVLELLETERCAQRGPRLRRDRRRASTNRRRCARLGKAPRSGVPCRAAARSRRSRRNRPASQTANETPDSSSDTSRYCPTPLRVSLAQRRHDAERDVEARDQIADRHADFRRRAAGRARDAHQAAARLRHDVEARSIGERSVLAESRRRRVDDARIHGANVVIDKTERAHRAGTQILDDDVRRRREAQERCLPPADFKSSATERLCRFKRRNGELSPLTNGPDARTGSPARLSILMTSAPRSASCNAANGAAMKTPISSTRTPASAPEFAAEVSPLIANPARPEPTRRPAARARPSRNPTAAAADKPARVARAVSSPRSTSRWSRTGSSPRPMPRSRAPR